MEIRKVEYFDGKVRLEASVASSTKQKRPVILIFPSWAGKDAFVEEKAIELAKQGYVACAMDLYGDGIVGGSKEENGRLMAPFMTDRKFLQKRILSYRSLLKNVEEADEKNVGAIGYCFGGLCALDLCRCDETLKAVVSFHALLQAPPEQNNFPIRAKVLALHGAQDPMVSQDDIVAFQKEMTERNADWQLHVFGGAMHAFTNPQAQDPDFGTVYHSSSDRRSWNQMKAHFSEVFPLD
jgi:dienelactone hydrolase